MGTALIGLAGVIVGALIAGVTDYFFERRRESAEDAIARRLVAEEVQGVWLHLRLLVDHRTTPRYPLGVGETASEFLPTRAWEANRRTLARTLDDSTWWKLALVAHAAARLRMAFALDTPERPLNNDEIARFDDLSETAREVFPILAPGRAIDEDP